MIDVSRIEVHPHATGARERNQEMSRSREGALSNSLLFMCCLLRKRHLQSL